MIHDGDPIAETLRFFHVVSGEKHRLPLAAEIPDDVPEVSARLRVETGRGLVEKDELRRSPTSAQAMASLWRCPPGELDHPARALFGEAGELENLLDRTPPIVEAAEEDDGLLDRQLVRELGLLERDPESLPHRVIVLAPSLSEDLDLAAGRRREAPRASRWSWSCPRHSAREGRSTPRPRSRDRCPAPPRPYRHRFSRDPGTVWRLASAS